MILGYLAIILLVYFHIYKNLGLKRGVLFVLVSSTTGFIFEATGVNLGIGFGGNYFYRPNGLMILGVPFITVIFWSVFIYIGYSLTNLFLYCNNTKKANLTNKNYYLLLLLIIIDGLLLVGIDLYTDPLNVYKGTWTWVTKGPYFGIPLGNFLGWFLVTVISTGVFRTYEYNKPIVRRFDKHIIMFPLLFYFSLWLYYTASAIKFGMFDLLLVGSSVMLPVIFFGVLNFLRHLMNPKPQ